MRRKSSINGRLIKSFKNVLMINKILKFLFGKQKNITPTDYSKPIQIWKVQKY